MLSIELKETQKSYVSYVLLLWTALWLTSALTWLDTKSISLIRIRSLLAGSLLSNSKARPCWICAVDKFSDSPNLVLHKVNRKKLKLHQPVFYNPGELLCTMSCVMLGLHWWNLVKEHEWIINPLTYKLMPKLSKALDYVSFCKSNISLRVNVSVSISQALNANFVLRLVLSFCIWTRRKSLPTRG